MATNTDARLKQLENATSQINVLWVVLTKLVSRLPMEQQKALIADLQADHATLAPAIAGLMQRGDRSSTAEAEAFNAFLTALNSK